MVTTLSPCWYCSGLVRQFGIGAVVVGEAQTFHGGHHWLAEHGVEVTVLDDERCVALMTDFIAARPELWFEDIGEAP
jgi:cytosine deaminase